MHYPEALEAVRRAAPYAVAELAERAGISRPTLYRLLSGAVPRADDLQELAIASGLDLEIQLRELSDPLAGVAARLELGDETVRDWETDATPWRERLQRFLAAGQHLQPEVALIDEAGRAAAPGSRPGAVHLRGDHRNVDRLVSAGRASGGRWALSGWAALDALGIDSQSPTIMWTEDVRRTAQLLHDAFRSTRPGSADLIVVAAHPSVFAGASPIEDVELVSPLQAHLDAVGLGGDARDRALISLGGAS